MVKWLMLLIGAYGTTVGIRASRKTDKDFVDVLASDVSAIKKGFQTGKDKIKSLIGSEATVEETVEDQALSEKSVTTGDSAGEHSQE